MDEQDFAGHRESVGEVHERTQFRDILQKTSFVGRTPQVKMNPCVRCMNERSFVTFFNELRS